MHKHQKPMDALRDEARLLGESRRVRGIEQVDESAAKAVIAAVMEFKARTNVSEAFIGRAIGVSASVVSEVLRQCYPGNWRQVIFDLDRWLEDEVKREQAPRPTEFVSTSVAEEIMAVAETAVVLKTMGLVYGPSGIGKTIALRAVAAEKPGSILISIETASATMGGLVRELTRALRVSPRGAYPSVAELKELIKEKLRGTPRLLIIDEAHKLCGGRVCDEKALNFIRDLHDHTELPVLLCGTSDVVAYLEEEQARGKEPMAQIRSRIGICRDLAERTVAGDGGPGEPLFSSEEIRKVFAKSKMRLSPDAVRYLMHLANAPDSGGLRTCRNLVVMATRARRGAEELTAEDLRAVHRLLATRRSFTLVEAKIEQYQPPRPMAKVG